MGNDVIYETVISTVSAAGVPHLAPMGVRYDGDQVVLMPYRPSTTRDNVLATGVAVLNIVVDTRVFAGAVTGRRDWPLLPATQVAGQRLACALGHAELRMADTVEEAERTVLRMQRVCTLSHAPFIGFNRAQAAVLEGAVLVSRLRLLPPDKVAREMAYLQIAIDKTAGPAEREGWGWLCEAVARHAQTPDAGPTPGARHHG